MFRSVRIALLLAPLVAGVGCPHSHDHPHPHDDAAAEEEAPTLAPTIFTDRYQAFVEFPIPVAGEPIEFLAHFTELATGAPVEDGGLEVVATPVADAELRERVDAPRRPGLYVPTLTFPSPGEVDLAFRLGAPHDETFRLGRVTVHPDADAAAAAAPTEDAGANEVSFLLEQQWRVGVLLHRVEREELTERIRVPGRVVPRHGNAAHVTPPVPGSIAAPPSGLPELGERVEEGSLLAYLRPPLPVTEAAALAANRAQLTALRQTLLLEQTSLDVRRAELAARLATLESELEFATRTAARTEALFGKGLATEQERDDARRARSTTATDRDGTASLLARIEAAIERLGRLAGEASPNPPEGEPAALLLPLHAPISGRLVQAECIEGQFFEPTDVVFEIIDTAIVWVEARVPEFDLPSVPPEPTAQLRVPGHAETLIDLRTHAGAGLAHFSPVVDTATHAARILFEVPNEDRRLRVGQSLDVLLETRTSRRALAVPASAVVHDSGETFVYVLAGGETFETRYVTTGIEDGGRIEIVEGIAEGERVVSRGAPIVRLHSLAPEGAVDHHH